MKFFRFLIIFVIMLIGGVMFLFNGIRDKFEWDKPHGELETITEKDLYVGRIVEGEIYELWDEFAYTTEYDTTMGVQTSEERTTDRYFALPLESSFDWDRELMFVAVSSRKSSELRVFDVMAQESVDYYDYGIEHDEYTSTHFIGKVKRLKGEYLGWFGEYVAHMMEVSEEEASEYYAPYVLESYTNPDSAVVMIVIGAIMSFIGVGGSAILVLRRIVRGR